MLAVGDGQEIICAHYGLATPHLDSVSAATVACLVSCAKENSCKGQCPGHGRERKPHEQGLEEASVRL